MIDWHTHILPEMDDGSKSVEESIEMLKMQSSQGIETVIATPHFYANDESVQSFLERRNASFEKLRRNIPEGLPEILLGAEVRYYQGISRMENIKALRIEGSKLLLLEMPMDTWTEYMIRELIELSSKSGIKLVLAHIERYMGFQKHSVIDRLLECDILMQVNASYFISLASKRKALSLMKKGKIQFVGSDCHNLTSRPPQIGKAYELLNIKFGKGLLAQLNEFGYDLLNI